MLANVNSINDELQMTLIPFSPLLSAFIDHLHSSHIIKYVQCEHYKE